MEAFFDIKFQQLSTGGKWPEAEKSKKKVWLATKNWIGDEKRHPILYNWRVSRGPSRLASILANGP